MYIRALRELSLSPLVGLSLYPFVVSLFQFIHLFINFFLHIFYPGTDVMILKIFLPKNLAKILPFFSSN
jgi:hypothetical protein